MELEQTLKENIKERNDLFLDNFSLEELKNFEGKDRPGFRIETLTKKYRILTKRHDYKDIDGKDEHNYRTAIFDNSVKNCREAASNKLDFIIAIKRGEIFNDAIIAHVSAVNNLKERGY
ncbi:MAG: hypothetical protein QXD13_01375 [Candidatus Pacearchaeota archaeon]